MIKYFKYAGLYKIIPGLMLTGALTGYFLIHPVTMIIYGYEFNHGSLPFLETVNRLLSSFSFPMMPMSIVFLFMGGFTGLGVAIYLLIHRKNDSEENLTKLNQKKRIKQILKILKNGENQTTGFLTSLRYDYRQVRVDKSIESITLVTIAGFLNTEGGRLLIGVDKFGKITGLDSDYWTLKRKDREGFQQRIISIVSAGLGTDMCPLLHISFFRMGETEICCIQIEPAKRPVFVKENQRTVFYIRAGSVTKPLSTKETIDYLRSGNRI